MNTPGGQDEMSGFTTEERENYARLKMKNPTMSSQELRAMATSPSGHLPVAGVGRHPVTGKFVPLAKKGRDGITRSGTRPAGQGVRMESGGAPGQEPTQ